MSGSDDLRLTFDAGKRRFRVRAVMWASVVWGIAMTAMALHTGLSMTLPVEEGGGLAPLSHRLGAGMLILLIAIAFPIGMHVYGSCYVVRITSNEHETVEVYETIGWLRPKAWTVTTDDVGAVKHHEGRLEGFYDSTVGLGMQTVEAGHTSIRTKNRRLPFIIDDQGDYYVWATGKKLGDADGD